MTFALSPRALRRLTASALTLMVLGVGAVVTTDYAATGWPTGIAAAFYLDFERNVPAWFSAVLLLLCALRLADIAGRRARAADPMAARWALLAVVFAFLSLDEASSFHERLIDPVRSLLGVSGAFYFAWVIPGIIFVAALAWFYRPLVFGLPRRESSAFMLAATLYVGGAVGIEILGGLYADLYGVRTTAFGLITTVEESCEIAGLLIFLRALHLPVFATPRAAHHAGERQRATGAVVGPPPAAVRIGAWPGDDPAPRSGAGSADATR